MDTIIVGGDFANSIFYIGDSATTSNNSYYFKDKFNTTVNIKARGCVYALEPRDLIVFTDSPVKNVNKLHNKLDQFIYDHTDARGQINYDDTHPYPARSHQIEQLVDYANAKKAGRKHLTFDAATGSGKSYTIGRLMTLQPPGRKALIVTSRPG